MDDQENELGVNCVAVLCDGDYSGMPGAISVSALAFRMPLSRLIDEVPTIARIVDSARVARPAAS